MLACVDGTGSKSWMAIRPDTGRYNSNTRNFFIDCLDTPKEYFDGPETLGLEVVDIVGSIWNFLMTGLRNAPARKVHLIGHSRGGHIVTVVAGFLNRYGWLKYVSEKDCPTFAELYQLENLMTPMDAVNTVFMSMRLDSLKKRYGIDRAVEAQSVAFLGLYDAVDRSLYFNTSMITANVRLAYHAVRDPTYHSRDSFGNTARHFDEPASCSIRDAAKPCSYHEKIIHGSHGAIGGDPGGGDIKYVKHLDIVTFSDTMRPAALQQCSTPVASTTVSVFMGPMTAPMRGFRYECNTIDLNVRRTELEASVAADAFIRAGARTAGLTFK